MLTVVLLAGAGLMMRSFLTLYQLDLGVDGDRVLTARVQLVNQKYPEPEQRVAFVDALTERLQAMPGVSAVSVASNLPMGGGDRRTLEIDGRPTEAGTAPPQVSVVGVGDDYLASIGLDTLIGRGLTRRDGLPGSEAVVVNARFVARFLDGEELLGRRIRLDIDEDEDSPGPWMRIVGVSPTVRQNAIQETEPDAVVYRRHRLAPGSLLAIQVYAPGDPGALVSQLREAVRAVDRDLPIFQPQTLSEGLAEQRWAFWVFGSLFAIFASSSLRSVSTPSPPIPSPSADRKSGSGWRSAPSPIMWCGSSCGGDLSSWRSVSPSGWWAPPAWDSSWPACWCRSLQPTPSPWR